MTNDDEIGAPPVKGWVNIYDVNFESLMRKFLRIFSSKIYELIWRKRIAEEKKILMSLMEILAKCFN